MFCSTTQAVVMYTLLGAKHIAEVWRTRWSSLARLSKTSSSPVKTQAYHNENDDYERIRKWQKPRNDKCYSKVYANPNDCFNHILFCIIVHFYGSTQYDSGYWYYFKVILYNILHHVKAYFKTRYYIWEKRNDPLASYRLIKWRKKNTTILALAVSKLDP